MLQSIYLSAAALPLIHSTADSNTLVILIAASMRSDAPQHMSEESVRYTKVRSERIVTVTPGHVAPVKLLIRSHSDSAAIRTMTTLTLALNVRDIGTIHHTTIEGTCWQ